MKSGPTCYECVPTSRTARNQGATRVSLDANWRVSFWRNRKGYWERCTESGGGLTKWHAAALPSDSMKLEKYTAEMYA